VQKRPEHRLINEYAPLSGLLFALDNGPSGSFTGIDGMKPLEEVVSGRAETNWCYGLGRHECGRETITYNFEITENKYLLIYEFSSLKYLVYIIIACY
jgi:hypothetical protein